MAGEAGPGGSERAAARHSSPRVTPPLRVTPPHGSGPAGGLPRRQSLTALCPVFTEGWICLARGSAGLPGPGPGCRGADASVGSFLRCLSVDVHPSSCEGRGRSEPAASLPGWATCFRGGPSAEGA